MDRIETVWCLTAEGKVVAVRRGDRWRAARELAALKVGDAVLPVRLVISSTDAGCKMQRVDDGGSALAAPQVVGPVWIGRRPTIRDIAQLVLGINLAAESGELPPVETSTIAPDDVLGRLG